jgi:hypothetical protein
MSIFVLILGFFLMAAGFASFILSEAIEEYINQGANYLYNFLFMSSFICLISGIVVNGIEEEKELAATQRTDTVCIVKTWTDASVHSKNSIHVDFLFRDRKGIVYIYDELNPSIHGVVEAGNCFRVVHRAMYSSTTVVSREGLKQIRDVIYMEPVIKKQEPLCN